MIFSPVLVGLAWAVSLTSLIGSAGSGDRGPGGADMLRMSLTTAAVTVAWVAGYLTFFTVGKWLPARRSGNRRILRAAGVPLACYGSVTAVAVVCAVLLQPHLLWWAVVFAPLTVVSVYEIWRGTPRSLIAGAAETVTSALVIAALATTGPGSTSAVTGGITLTRNVFSSEVVASLPPELWVTVIWLALYQVGTVLYVKTMIRERGSRPWWRGSVAFHVVALAVTTATVFSGDLAVVPWLIAEAVMVRALWRSWSVPRQEVFSRRTEEATGTGGSRKPTWTPRKVGLAEVPLVVAVTVAGILTAILFNGPILLYIG